MSMLAPTLQAFFTDRLARQRQASPRTVTAYRDTFRLLLAFVQRQIGKAPFALGFEHLEATVIVAFLNHIEADRHNSPRTRKRSTGRHSFVLSLRGLGRIRPKPRYAEQEIMPSRRPAVPEVNSKAAVPLAVHSA